MNNRENHAQRINYDTTSLTDLGREEANGSGSIDLGEQDASGKLLSLEINRKLEQIRLRYEIPTDKCYRLRALKDYEIIVIGDDSGSMNTTVDNTNVTRWDELRNLLKIIIEFGTIFDPSGFALSFQFSFGVNTFFHFTTHRTNLKERMGNCCSGLQKDGKNGPPPPDRQSGPPPPPVRGRDDDNRGGDPRGGGPGPAGRQKK
ncbi:unnamed protein product [Adineta ricciae]|uniref:Uncharacterized protein n=1 Tax=Adineta ricciae TaxID=249248 RepID=A0A815B1R1_ADIRI|nr:unnamed protein product [Adineta ricciae]